MCSTVVDSFSPRLRGRRFKSRQGVQFCVDKNTLVTFYHWVVPNLFFAKK